LANPDRHVKQLSGRGAGQPRLGGFRFSPPAEPANPRLTLNHLGTVRASDRRSGGLRDGLGGELALTARAMACQMTNAIPIQSGTVNRSISVQLSINGQRAGLDALGEMLLLDRPFTAASMNVPAMAPPSP
jgi:hypothetical protein